MANYWAIAIGINQYQLFPPLGFAQADAEAIRDFLVMEGGFLPQNCLLMKNTGSTVDPDFYPTKVSILSLLEELAAKSWEPEDHLWLFFSGYGINYQEKDYLMSAEGNPDLVPETGIEMRSLMHSLQIAGLNVLLILDINRAFGTQADDPVGEEIIELAKELQIATILACQPEEFSHENSELGHGIFTSVLLSALKSGAGTSLTELASYLNAVTPKVCQQQWLPIQNPLVVIPSPPPEILPPVSLDSHPQPSLEPNVVIFPEETFAVNPLGDSSQRSSTVNGDKWTQISTLGTTLSQTSLDLDQQQQRESVSESSIVSESKLALDSNYPQLADAGELNSSGRYIPSLTQTYGSPPNQTNNPLGRQFILWGVGSMVVVGSIVSFFLCNHHLFRFKQSAADVTSNVDSQKQIPQTLPSHPTAFRTSSTNGQNTAITSSQLGLAISDNQRHQAIQELKKMSLRPDQAKDLLKSINQAQKIPSSDPSYAKSQENIKTWDQMILELAISRAQKRQYNLAIKTAELIPQNQESFYPQAQTAINQWRLESKQYVSNKTLLDAANALIEHGQASTYNRAIEVAKKVASGEPGFDLAQKSINRWSEKILDLAKNRATQGKLAAAIATAKLVPGSTSAYDDAQDAIQKWQTRKKQE